MTDRTTTQRTGSQPARMLWCTSSQTANNCHYSILQNTYCYLCALENSQRQSWLLKQPMLSKLIGGWFMLLLQWHTHNSLCKHCRKEHRLSLSCFRQPLTLPFCQKKITAGDNIDTQPIHSPHAHKKGLPGSDFRSAHSLPFNCF